MASLLITADDFGLHSSVNNAIIKCVERDVVNSVSIIANGQEPAIQALHWLEQFRIFRGVHLTWVGEKWMTENILIPDWPALVKALFTSGKSFRKKLFAEGEAQINMLLRNNINPDHIDSHQHVHVLPALWKITRELQAKYSISRIRIPRTKNLQLRRSGIPGYVLNALSKQHSKHSVFTCAGLRHTGNYDIPLLEKEFALCSGSDTELIVHPGENNALLNQRYSRWRFDWEKEFHALTDERFKQALGKHGFHLLRKN